jgi:Tol biopolymer transport system component
VKVLDFGIAKLTDARAFGPAADSVPSALSVETAPGVVMGTAHYMSPEQARGFTVDARTDVWSLGVVLYEMIAGRPPFEGATPSDVIAAILDKSPPPLARYAPDVPGEAQWIINRGLRKDREERYQTIKEMLSDLRDVKQELDARARLVHSLAPNGIPAELTRTGTTQSTRQQPGTNSQPIETVVAGRTTSSAEYLIGEVRRHKLVATSVFIVVLLLGAGLVFGLYRLVAKRAHRVPFETMNVSRLTTSGNAVAAAVSPDGKYAAYVSADAGGQSVWVRQTATASTVQIVPSVPVQYEGLTFSRDSNYVYCFRWDRRKPDTELLKVPTLGGLAQSLPVVPGSSITFSPDGRQFAFIELHTTVGKSALVTAAVDTGGRRVVAERQQPDFFVAFPGAPAWSPDGQTIACAVGTSDATGQHVEVMGIKVNDGKESRLSPKRWASVRELSWLADGSGLVITARERLSAPMQIWWLDNVSGEAARITNDLNDYSGISLTGDSASLVTVHSDEATHISVAPTTEFSRVQKIGTEAGRMEELVWLPDGRIVYRSNATGDANLWVMNADGTNKRQLTTGAGALFGLSVSPDGKYLVFSSDRAGHFNLWRFDLATGGLKQLTDGDGEIHPSCAPDGRWVVYQHGYSLVKPTLWRVPLEGGQPVQLTDTFSMWPAVSPDGRLIAYSYFDGDQKPAQWSVGLIAFDGGPPLKRFAIAMAETRMIHWTPDGQALAYVDNRGGEVNVWAQPLEGSPAHQLTYFKGEEVFSFAWSVDGKRVAFMHGNPTKDVVLINDFR